MAGRPLKIDLNTSRDNHHYSKKEALIRNRSVEALVADKSKLTPPDYLKGKERSKYEEIICNYEKLHKAVDFLNDLDSDQLAMYCQTFVVYRDARNQWEKLRVQIKKAMVEYRRSPNKKLWELIASLMLEKKDCDKTMRDNVDTYLKLANSLGLTPMGRFKICLNHEKDRDPGRELVDLFKDTATNPDMKVEVKQQTMTISRKDNSNDGKGEVGEDGN